MFLAPQSPIFSASCSVMHEIQKTSDGGLDWPRDLLSAWRWRECCVCVCARARRPCRLLLNCQRSYNIDAHTLNAIVCARPFMERTPHKICVWNCVVARKVCRPLYALSHLCYSTTCTDELVDVQFIYLFIYTFQCLINYCLSMQGIDNTLEEGGGDKVLFIQLH